MANSTQQTEFRAFTVEEAGDFLVITEIEPKHSHPMNWSGMGEYSREGAWFKAQTQGLETVFVSRSGERRELGRIFDPRAFERAAYQGYVSYGLSMTDGHYAPIRFEDWVRAFRANPETHLAFGNDASESVKAAFPLYQEALLSLAL